MEYKRIARWLKIMIIGMFAAGTVVYFWAVPEIGKAVYRAYPENAGHYWPWLVGVWVTAIPCYLAGVFCWKIAACFAAQRPFTVQNAANLTAISRLALVDAGYFLVLNLVLLGVGCSHPGVLLVSLLVCFVGTALAVAVWALAHLVKKAAELQQESDYTV